MPRLDRGVAQSDEVRALLAADAPVAMGVSGGKDSCVLALATCAHLDAIGHAGPRLLIHSDLGRVEWRQSAEICARLATRTGLEIITVRRGAGDMMDRWLTRWTNNLERYINLECVKLILPWSTAAMRFCTSELKTAIICRALIKRFPGQTIVSASGIRRQESSNRAKAPVWKPQPKLTSRAHATTGIDWHPVIDWLLADVLAYLKHHDFALHEAYTTYHSSRVSCAFCILGSQADLAASATCPDNADIYREMVDLEITSTFSFQEKWLGDVASHLLTDRQRDELALAKARASARERAEAVIPKHLLFTKGWPTVMPTYSEAELLCGVRKEVGALIGAPVLYTEPTALMERYEDLMRQAAA
jgi:3'-phosphoadenosine 5'-phosphosulfate sulfotransferase (PAPS reductase)/FAD synthetase